MNEVHALCEGWHLISADKTRKLYLDVCVSSEGTVVTVQTEGWVSPPFKNVRTAKIYRRFINLMASLI